MLHVPKRHQQGCTLIKIGGKEKIVFLLFFLFSLSSSFFSLSRCLSHRIIIRQIRLSASYLHDMTILACGASLVFVIQLQTPRTCPLHKPPRLCPGVCAACKYLAVYIDCINVRILLAIRVGLRFSCPSPYHAVVRPFCGDCIAAISFFSPVLLHISRFFSTFVPDFVRL